MEARRKQNIIIPGIKNESVKNFAKPAKGEEYGPWKVLIMDAAGQRILAPLMTVNELRGEGVTLYLQLQSINGRQKIPGAPSIYFIDGSCDDSIARVCKDAQEGLYSSMQLNMTSSIPRANLERLATCEGSHLIVSLFDQFMDYICIEENLFISPPPPLGIAGLTSNFHIFNSTKSSEDDISTVIKGISNSIFSVLLAPSVSEESSVSLAPLIVSLLGGPAESVSRKLDRRIRDYNLDLAKNIPESKKPGVDFKVQRPLVIVIDRSVDIGAMLSHHSAYNALVQDVLGVGGTGQRVSIPPGDSTSPSKDASTSRHHDLDARDWFWQSNRSILFPTVADNMDSALKDYLKEEEQVRGRGSTNPDAMSAEELRVAISVLPELAEKKRIIWAHRQICVALLDAIKKRTLADLIHLQSSSTLDPKKVLDILSSSNTSGPTAMDKMRLFLIFFMKNYTLNDNLMNFKPYEDVLKAGGCDMRPVEFCKKFCSFLGRSARIFEESSSFSPLAATINRVKSPISSTSTNQGDLLQRITGAGGLFGTMMMSSVRSLMTDTPQAVTPITRIIDAALESAVSGASTIPGRIGLIDPRNSNSEVSISGANPQRTAFDHIIIYLVGGTNYAEYNHVSDFIKHQKRVVPASISSSSSVRFTFGSTDFVSPEQFLTTLSEIN